MGNATPVVQVEKAVEEGYDVRGFMYWTLVDNFEWAFAYELKFGLYEFNPEWSDTSKRRLKEGSQVCASGGCVIAHIARPIPPHPPSPSPNLASEPTDIEHTNCARLLYKHVCRQHLLVPARNLILLHCFCPTSDAAVMSVCSSVMPACRLHSAAALCCYSCVTIAAGRVGTQAWCFLEALKSSKVDTKDSLLDSLQTSCDVFVLIPFPLPNLLYIVCSSCNSQYITGNAGAICAAYVIMQPCTGSSQHLGSLGNSLYSVTSSVLMCLFWLIGPDAQVIKKHYAELPDKLGRLLANQKRSANSKSETEKESEDDRQEAKFLREEGFSKDEIQDALPEEDPVTAGTED